MPRQKRGNGEGTWWQVKKNGVPTGVYRCAVPDGRDPLTGKLKRRHGRAASEAAIKRVLLQLQLEVMNGLPVLDASETTERYLNRWLEDVIKPEAPEGTHTSYRNWLRIILPYIGTVKLSDLKPQHLQIAFGQLSGSYAPATLANVKAVLHTAFHRAVGWELIPRNPTEFVSLPRQKKPDRPRLTHAEARRLYEAAGETQWRCLWMLLATSGLRISEALRMPMSQIADGPDGQPMAVTVIDGKTENAARRVPLTPAMSTELARHRLWQKKRRLQYADVWRDHGLVFSTDEGREISRSTSLHRFKAHLTAAGLSDMRLHDLRGTYVSWCREAGIDADVVQQLVGHANIATTLDIYGRVNRQRIDAAAEKLARYLA